jgi:hypothetical protein
VKPIIATAYFKNIDTEIVEWHEKVVKALYPEVKYVQVLTNSHPSAMNQFTMDALMMGAYTHIVWLDIDCIPLNDKAIYQPYPLTGCAQRANHINNGGHIYASPFAMILNLKWWQQIGFQYFNETVRGDVGEELTYAAERIGIRPELFYPSHVEAKPDGGYWNLTDDTHFGYGTTYADEDGTPMFYHAFEIRKGENKARFIAKCKEVLKGFGAL